PYTSARCGPVFVFAPGTVVQSRPGLEDPGGVDRPLWSELVPAYCRGKIIGWWRTIAETCGTIFGGPLVGYISVAILGYKPSQDLQQGNAESLGTAMLVCTMLPWAFCLCCYSAIHCTYPKDCRSEVSRLLPKS
ncbi:unnamed protein product, partial [Durusdinium trenchii]